VSDETVTKSMSVLRENLGVTEIEARILLPIYLGGNMTAGGVSLLSGEKMASVKRALGRLQSKGLIREVEGRVPVYQALPPGLSLGAALSERLENIDRLMRESENLVSDRSEQIDAAVESVVSEQSQAMETIRESLTKYEESLQDLVKTQIDSVVSTSSSVMTKLSEELEGSMHRLDTSLDDHLGTKMKELQTGLDKEQVALAKSLRKIAVDFDKWLKAERVGVLASAEEFEKKSQETVQAAKNAVTAALTESSESLKAIATGISESLTSLASNASDEGLEILNSVSTDITDFIAHLDADLAESYLSGQKSLEEVIAQASQTSKEYGEFARSRISTAREIAGGIGELAESWKDEVGGFMDVASQSVRSQLEQVASTDANYLEMMKTSLTSHIEKVNTALGKEYEELNGLANTLGADCETTLAETRTMLLDLLQSQVDSEQESCDTSSKGLQKELDGWVHATISSIEKTLKEAATDIGGILDTESSEMNDIADAMSSRLKSAFGTVIKSTQTKNEALLTAVKSAANDFETSIGERLSEIMTNFSSATQSQVKDSKVLYEGLRDRLDKRMARSVSSITSHSEKVQKDIDAIIEEQVTRMDQHTTAIKDEFHTHLSDITKQFMTLTQGLEATFNGLVSSQVVEARDLISSSHSEFKNALKNEMVSLKDESTKLQQEYATDLGMRIEEVTASVDAAKRALNELALEKRHEISERMAKTLGDLDDAVRSTEGSLVEMESGTVKQFIDNLAQVSQEFNVTVAGARDNITEKLENAGSAAKTSLEKSSGNAKAAADGFVDSQQDLKQRFLADTSKKINRLATRRVKAAGGKIETFRSELSARETGGVKERSKAKTEVIDAVEKRRSEVLKAFHSASEWVDSAVSNMATSLEQLGSKLKNELTLIERGLQKAAEESEAAIRERGDLDVEKLQEITAALLQNAEAMVNSRLDEFADKCSSSLTRGSENLTSMPTEISEQVGKIQTGIEEKTSESYGEVATGLSTRFTEYERAAHSATEEFRNLLEAVSISLTEKRDESADAVEKNASNANQMASRKFETLGLEVKTALSGETSVLLEQTQSDISEKNQQITESVTDATNKMNEETSALRQSRSEILSGTSEKSEKALRKWSTDQKKRITALSESLVEALNDAKDTTSEVVKTVEAIHELSKTLLKAPPKRTWYLSGQEEACAYILDMAGRAEESIVISVPDLECIDLKQLAKVKDVQRKVLFLPDTEEAQDIESVDGWRVWRTKTPVLLAIADEKELLIGASTAAERPLVIVSEEDSYLRIYHDIIGPRLVAGRIR
jgi:sugar-specific transcriptional regulator TrmB